MKDIKTDYFEYIHEETEIPSYRAPVKTTDKNIEQQYVNYQYLNYKSLTPFIRRYFSPSQLVKGMIDELVYKYDIDYDNTCVLFYRGNDKVKENHLPSYDKYLTHAKIIQRLYPDIRFLVQSDETEFLEYMEKAFPVNHVIFYDEIRHMPRNPLTTVDRLFSRDVTAELSKYYLAITYIMSKCRYVVCGTGNCSFWIALFRGGFDGITQFNYWTSAHKPEAH